MKESRMSYPKQPRPRHHLVRDVAARVDGRRDGLVPWDDELAVVFLDQDDLLVAMHARWHRILAVRIDPLIERGSSGDEFVAEWRALADDTPGQRLAFERGVLRSTARFRQVSDRQDAALAVAAGLVPAGASPPLAAQVWRAAVSTTRTRADRRAIRTLSERMRDRCPLRSRRLAA
jgi:hypothetical protein